LAKFRFAWNPRLRARVLSQAIPGRHRVDRPCAPSIFQGHVPPLVVSPPLERYNGGRVVFGTCQRCHVKRAATELLGRYGSKKTGLKASLWAASAISPGILEQIRAPLPPSAKGASLESWPSGDANGIAHRNGHGLRRFEAEADGDSTLGVSTVSGTGLDFRPRLLEALAGNGRSRLATTSDQLAMARIGVGALFTGLCETVRLGLAEAGSARFHQRPPAFLGGTSPGGSCTASFTDGLPLFAEPRGLFLQESR